MDNIKSTLTSLRAAKVPLTTQTIRAVVIARIDAHTPTIFTQKISSDGSYFRASKPWLRSFLKNEMHWSICHTTRPAQKLLENVDEVLLKSALRQAFSIRNYNIPADLRVNTDQTQMVLQHSAKVTWNQSGEKQVTAHGFGKK